MINSKSTYLCLIILVLISCNQVPNGSSNSQQINSKQEMKIEKKEGVITKVSAQNFEQTYKTVVNIITNNPNLKIIAELDHQANAASVGLELNPTRIIMFGNPKLGTPLMQKAQTTGLDLPQKILIWQDDQDNVHISYNDPMYLKGRHDIEENDDVLLKISNALDTITGKAIQNQ